MAQGYICADLHLHEASLLNEAPTLEPWLALGRLHHLLTTWGRPPSLEKWPQHQSEEGSLQALELPGVPTTVPPPSALGHFGNVNGSRKDLETGQVSPQVR